MKKVVGAFVNLVSVFAMDTALRWVHGFFSTPRKGKLTVDHLPAFLKKAHRSFFWYQNEKVYTYQWNNTLHDLPIVLLIHGWESNSARWEALYDYMGDQFHYVAVDAPSLGLSYGKNLSVQNYQEVIDLALQTFQPQFAIGHSLGAFALFQQLGLSTYPGLKKAVILGTFDRFEIVLSHYYHLLGYTKRIRSAYDTYLEQLFNKPLIDYCCTAAVPFVEVEVLCIHDLDDPQVSFEEAINFHQALKRKNNLVIPTSNLGHSLQDTSVYHAILSFLR